MRTSMKPPPPMFPAAGSTTASAKAVATAASTALPPFSRISTPAREASSSSVVTIPCAARTGSAGQAFSVKARSLYGAAFCASAPAHQPSQTAEPSSHLITLCFFMANSRYEIRPARSRRGPFLQMARARKHHIFQSAPARPDSLPPPRCCIDRPSPSALLLPENPRLKLERRQHAQLGSGNCRRHLFGRLTLFAFLAHRLHHIPIGLAAYHRRIRKGGSFDGRAVQFFRMISRGRSSVHVVAYVSSRTGLPSQHHTVLAGSARGSASRGQCHAARFYKPSAGENRRRQNRKAGQDLLALPNAGRPDQEHLAHHKEEDADS